MSLLTTIYEDKDVFVDALERNMCSAIPVIAQNLGTCWFNAILMAMIYSDGLSKLVIKKVVDESWNKSCDNFKKKFTIFICYISTIKLKFYDREYLKDIENFKTFLQAYTNIYFLEEFLRVYDRKFLYLLESPNSKFYISYMYKILKKLKFNVYLLTTDNTFQKFYLNIKYDYKLNKTKSYDFKSRVIIHPDILLIEKLNIDLTMALSTYPFKNKDEIKGIGDETLIYEGNEYKLDCILLSNDRNHTILGLTCNGREYVYNGWKNYGKPCELMPFEWKTRNDSFSLNERDCVLDIGEGRPYNFRNNEQIMVYIKKDVFS